MRAIGIVLAGGNSKRMRELSNKRAVAAMPVAGSYRSIDFALSNMTNSHIQNVAVFTQYNSRSLNLHLSSSKWWISDVSRADSLYSPVYHTGERRLVQGNSGRIIPEPYVLKEQP